jgi:hypothetical protein
MSRVTSKVARAADPLLEPGEHVEVATIATFGRSSIAKAAAIAAVTTVATGGLLTLHSYAKKVPIVLTTRRLLVLAVRDFLLLTPLSKIEVQAQRSDLRATPPVQNLLWTKLDLTFSDGTPIARMQFPLPSRGDAYKIAQLLGEPPPTLQGW